MKMIVHEFNGFKIRQRAEDGYINATEMCKVANKRWNNYWRQKETQEYLLALAEDLDLLVIVNNPVTLIRATALIQVIQGGNSQQGTWVHPEVAADLAQWVSIPFRIRVNRWIIQWMRTGNNPIHPQPTPTNTDISSVIEELEKLLISTRSHSRTIHTGSHQPVDPILFKSLHTLSHNQLGVINAAIQHLEMLKRIAEMNTQTEPTPPDKQQTINYLFPSPPPTRRGERKPTTTQQLTNINIKIPSSQRQWLADTARIVRQNNSKPVPPAQRVYPQHLVGIAIQLLQNSSIDIAAAHSIHLEQNEPPATINIKISRQQQQWLTDTAKTIRGNSQQPTCPSERIYPQHLISIAIELLQNAGVNWYRVGNLAAIKQGLITALFQIKACLV